ncbi:MAG: hypothetical protein NTV48_01075, partial [Candidatus Vogelbacteria bacterium]|nr:hypothetical protein [Candidatus Vogelbacteria bacterium]
ERFHPKRWRRSTLRWDGKSFEKKNDNILHSSILNSMKKIKRLLTILIGGGLFLFLFVYLVFFVFANPIDYHKKDSNYLASDYLTSTSQLNLPVVAVTHIKTPEAVKAIYLTSGTASSVKARERVLKSIAGTEINSIVLDIKDYTGKIVVKIDSPTLVKYDSFENRVPDIKNFIADLHSRGYYVIGHISVFQDNYLARRRPDLALKRKDNGAVWEDQKGMAWLDVSSEEVWDYAIAIAKESYAIGFDELNFDYIRFPSDGKISNVFYPFYRPQEKSRSDALQDFFVYLSKNMTAMGVPSSGNIFGLVTTNAPTNDMNIGQIFEKATPYFDYICPMIYPSHYPAGYLGYKNPAKFPYEIIKNSLDGAVKRIKAQGLSPKKLRPWLQDFNLGATYTASMVRAEKKGVYDAGVDSWLMWNASNKYTVSAYDKKQN